MTFSRRPAHSRKSSRNRRGVAAVEAAIVLPILVLIVIGTFETCQVMFMRNSVLISAYEGVRVAIVPGANEGNVQAMVQGVLQQRSLTPSSIQIEPADFSTQPGNTPIRVRVQLSARNNCSMPMLFHGATVVTEDAVLLLER